MCRLMNRTIQRQMLTSLTIKKLVNGSFASACLFRSGVCVFGLEDYEGAKKIFKEFIDAYPGDELMPESLTMYGDLLGADGELDDALAQYQRAVELVSRRYQFESDDKLRKGIVTAATYATVQAVKTLDRCRVLLG